MTIKVRRENKCAACPLVGDPDICLGQLNLTICRQAEVAKSAPQAGPGLVRMAANVAVAAVQHARAGFPRVADEVAAARLAICRSNKCGYHSAGDRCMHANCGCFLAVKCSWFDQACPLAPPLWGPGDYLDERGVTPE